MKIKPEDLTTLRGLVQPLDTPERRLCYTRGDFPRSELVKDLDKRYRWDLLADIPRPHKFRLVSGLYAYLNDSHIDTALRSFVKPLEKTQ